MTPITKERIGDLIAAGHWDRFVAEFRGCRYDRVLGEHYAYEQVLQDACERVCRRWEVDADPNAGRRLVYGVRSWGPPADVPAPLAKMAAHYQPRYAASEYIVDQLDASPEDFVHVPSHTRYDQLPMPDRGLPNTVLLDRGYDP